MTPLSSDEARVRCRRTRAATASNGALVALASLIMAGLLILALVRISRVQQSGREDSSTLMLYCAAGIRPPVEAAARQYFDEFGVRVVIQYGGSGTLLGGIEVNPRGDLYLAADESYIELARAKGLVAESIPLATMRPVIAVQAGNPKRIAAVDDLLSDDVRLGLANPDAAAIGRATRKALTASGDWDAIQAHTKVFKPTVTDVANDIKLGAIDAAILWDATVNQYAEIEAVRVAELEAYSKQITVGVLTGSVHATAALRFARYLGARDRGQLHFDALGYEPVQGDTWAKRPRLLLYAGSMFNQAIEATLQEFERREGVEIQRVYNGCGILVSQMRAGGRPDAYFSCDTSFMQDVADLFPAPMDISENPIVIITHKNNPHHIATLADLTRPGLRVGLAHPKKSALGHLTQRLLATQNLLEPLKQSGNWLLDAPQGDFLLNQLRAGGLDAAVVYASNAGLVRDSVEIIAIDAGAAIARQPYAIANYTEHAHTLARLRDALISDRSKDRFTRLGFAWRVEDAQ